MRRHLAKSICVALIGAFFFFIMNGPGSGLSRPLQDEIRFTPPPGEETPGVKQMIDEAQSSLERGETDATGLLTSFIYLRVHAFPRFRELIRKHAKPNATIVIPSEPGDALMVSGVIRDKRGTPINGALIYVYQTSSRGWYSDKAPHISGMAGDEKFARLFGYLKTGADGKYQFRTIRPAGYPRSDLPAHIHVEIETPDKQRRTLITEIQFEDDPRLTPEMRARSAREHLKIFPVSRGADGSQSVSADFQL